MYESFEDIEYLFPSPPVVEQGKSFTPLDFYSIVVPTSRKVQFKLGYFSSNAISVLSVGFASFIANGGQLELMINHFVNERDYKLLNDNDDLSGIDLEFIKSKLESNDLLEIHDLLNSSERHFFNCLKYLLNHTKQLTILPVTLKDGAMAHYKEALFTDKNNNCIYINGSSNFTRSGITDNGESFVFQRSWRSEFEKEMINHKLGEFKRIFSGVATESFIYIPPEKLIKVVNEIGESKTIEKLIEDEESIQSELMLKTRQNESLDKYYNELVQYNYKRKDKLRTLAEPSFPYESPRSYQKEAHEKWVENDKKGLFAMATGTGKTLTSLNCLLNEYREVGYYRAVIIVPTISLLSQWREECLKFNYQNIISISSKSDWKSELSFFNLKSKLIDTSFIVIVTYSSFTRKKFLDQFKEMPEDTLMIADEVHNMGSPGIKKVLPSIHLKKRIGLSATPNRVYDESGNTAIDEFFSDSAPYIYNFDMKKAIRSGFLCKYYYHPRVVQLTDDEQKKYNSISKQLMKFIDSQTGRYKQSKEVEILLLKRKRIIHKAENKIFAFRKILREEFTKKGSLKYSLVYTPEGVVENPEKFSDQYVENEDDLKLINTFTKEVRDVDPFLMVKKFTADLKNRDEVLKQYAKGDIDVLTSMKCLDEGVDVPRSELAIFCSSTGNPRQFIQRRGRVLRLAKGKLIATVYDLVVIPKPLEDGESSFQKSLVLSELRRVVNFSSLSENKSETFEVFNDICNEYGINLYELEKE